MKWKAFFQEQIFFFVRHIVYSAGYIHGFSAGAFGFYREPIREEITANRELLKYVERLNDEILGKTEGEKK